MARTGIGGEERCHVDEGWREGRHEVGRNWSSLQDRATIMNVEDAASLHSDNDIARVDIQGEEAGDRGDILQGKLGGQVLRSRSDLCTPNDLVQDIISATHRGMTQSIIRRIKSRHANMGASRGI